MKFESIEITDIDNNPVAKVKASTDFVVKEFAALLKSNIPMLIRFSDYVAIEIIDRRISKKELYLTVKRHVEYQNANGDWKTKVLEESYPFGEFIAEIEAAEAQAKKTKTETFRRIEITEEKATYFDFKPLLSLIDNMSDSFVENITLMNYNADQSVYSFYFANPSEPITMEVYVYPEDKQVLLITKDGPQHLENIDPGVFLKRVVG